MDPAGTPITNRILRLYAQPQVTGFPKYARLREALRKAILEGQWPRGSRLPTEDELTRITGLSLGTVQRSLRELADQGIVVRNQGSGTFVSPRLKSIDAPLHLRFAADDHGATFLPLYPKIVSRSVIAARGRWSDALNQAGKDIVRIDRKLSVNGEFIVFNRMYYKAEAFSEITALPLERLDGENLKQMLAGSFNFPLRILEQHVSLVDFDRETCKATGTKPGTRGMLLEGTATAGQGNVIYFMESFIPPNDRRLDISST